jgi:GMP reductase
MDFLKKELDFNDVLILPQPSDMFSRSQVKLEREFHFCNSHTNKIVSWTGIPIIAANMDTTGTFEVCAVLQKYKMVTALNKFYTVDDYKATKVHLDPEYFMVSTGISDENMQNLIEIMEYTKCRWICIDVANGYMQNFVNFCKTVRTLFPDKIIIAGNVVTGNMVQKLALEGGVDIIKVGIGSGSACLTRRQTGVGRPQLHTIIDCIETCKNMKKSLIADMNVYIASDGGIRYPGDMSKAFGAGADFVMLGGVFSGHDENPGEVIEENGQKYKLFYGMSSSLAMEKYFGKMEDYRSSEGAVIKVPYKGPIEKTVKDFLGGLRSTCTYVGAATIEDLPKCTTFVRV